MSSKALKVVVILGSTRDGRLGERVAKNVIKNLESAGHTVDFWDPLKIDLPLLRQPLHFYPDRSKAPSILHELNGKIEKSDAFVIVTPEYNRQLPPALLNLMDHFPPYSYSCKTSGVVAYSMGQLGGGIAAHNARVYLTELGCLPVSHMVMVPQANKEFNEDGTTGNQHIDSSIKKLIQQLEWWGTAARNQRESAGPLPPPQW